MRQGGLPTSVSQIERDCLELVRPVDHETSGQNGLMETLRAGCN